MAKLYDMCVKTGSYTDQTGTLKNRYKNIGVVMSGNDGGKYILLEKTFNPAGVPGDSDKDSCMVSLFEVKDQQNGSPTPPRSPQQHQQQQQQQQQDQDLSF